MRMKMGNGWAGLGWVGVALAGEMPLAALTISYCTTT